MRYLALVAFIAACQPAATPVNLGADGGTPEALCKHLADVGCSAGQSPFCVSAVSTAVNDKLFAIDVFCVYLATTADAAKKCAGVDCR